MDTGHYNCRDYHVSPHFSSTTLSNAGRVPLIRQESYKELEQRSRSPGSLKPKFPLLRLPLELRQHIYSYLIPYTKEQYDQRETFGQHVRNFSAVKKRCARGMKLPVADENACAYKEKAEVATPNIVWVRGCTSILAVCKQMHEEVAAMMYGRNTFLLFVTFSGVTFRFRWVLPSGLAPSRSYEFLELMPARYLRLVRNIIVHVDHVDSYTGMIKFNVSGTGLVHGLRRQVQRLVLALQPTFNSNENGSDALLEPLTKVIIKVSRSNSVLEQLNSTPSSTSSRATSATSGVSDDVKSILEPFGCLEGVRQVAVICSSPQELTGFEEFALELEERMRSTEASDRQH